MGAYRRILVPIEGTPTDDPVLEHVAVLAAALGAAVTLLRVAHFHTRDERAAEIDDARQDVERAASGLRAAGVDVETLIVPGEPGETIVAQAAELGADLIAMATHGHGWAKRMVLGSIADYVRHHSDVPLLLVQARSGMDGRASP
jgi:nucleotide-binding universal stress UspA family protein